MNAALWRKTSKTDNDFVFMQDSAPLGLHYIASHRAKATQNFLWDNTPDFISSQEWTRIRQIWNR